MQVNLSAPLADMNRFSLPLTRLVHENLSIVMCFAYSRTPLAEMVERISALLYQLHDSHTVFIPQKRKIKAVYGFKAKPFANNVFVYELEKDGPAAKAGLQLGDQIVGVNNINAVRETFFDMMRYLTALDPRAELDLEISQQGSVRLVKVPATVIPQPPQYFFSYIENGS